MKNYENKGNCTISCEGKYYVEGFKASSGRENFLSFDSNYNGFIVGYTASVLCVLSKDCDLFEMSEVWCSPPVSIEHKSVSWVLGRRKQPILSKTYSAQITREFSDR